MWVEKIKTCKYLNRIYVRNLSFIAYLWYGLLRPHTDGCHHPAKGGIAIVERDLQLEFKSLDDRIHFLISKDSGDHLQLSFTHLFYINRATKSAVLDTF